MNRRKPIKFTIITVLSSLKHPYIIQRAQLLGTWWIKTRIYLITALTLECLTRMVNEELHRYSYWGGFCNKCNYMMIKFYKSVACHSVKQLGTIHVQLAYIPEENIATVKTIARKETHDIKLCPSILLFFVATWWDTKYIFKNVFTYLQINNELKFYLPFTVGKLARNFLLDILVLLMGVFLFLQGVTELPLGKFICLSSVKAERNCSITGK